MNRVENLRFDKEDYLHVLVFSTGYFMKEIENTSPHISIHYRNTCGSLGECEIAISPSPKLPLFIS